MPEPVIIDFEGNATDLLNEAKKVQSAMDKTSSTLKEAGVSQAALNKALASSHAPVKQSATSWADLSGAVNIAETAIRLTGQAYTATVGEAQAYDQQIKGIMASTNGTADATSRIVQVLDDAGIEFDTVKMAMREMAKDGTAPSIEELAKLSDEFIKIQDPADRGQFLLDKFGKSGMNMARAMELGGTSILAMSEGMQGGLILTEENIAASEEYRKNIDALSDSWKGLTVSAGNATMPVLSEQIGDANALIESLQKNGYWYTVLHQNAIRNADDITKAAQEADYGTESYTAMAKAIEENSTALDESSISAEEQAAALKELSKANADVISGAIATTEANNKYNESQADITAQIEELTAKKAAMYPWEVDKIAEAQNKIDELSVKYEENAAAFVQAMETKAAMMAVEKIAMEDGVAGYSDAEFSKAQAILMTADVATAAAFNEQQAMQMVTDAVATGQISVEQFGSILDSVMADGKVSVDEVSAAINNIPTEKTVTVNVVTNTQYGAATIDSGDLASRGRGSNRHAAGGSFLIPSSYGNEGFRMGNGDTASAGETVTITPRGQSQNSNKDLIQAVLATKIDYAELARAIRDASLVSR